MVQQLTTNGTGFLATTTTGTTATTNWLQITPLYDPYQPIRYEWKYLGNETTIGGNVPYCPPTVTDNALYVAFSGSTLIGAFEKEKDAYAAARRYVAQDKGAVVKVFKAVKQIAAKPIETEETDL